MCAFPFGAKRKYQQIESKFCNTIIQYLWKQIDSIHDEAGLTPDLVGDIQICTAFLYSINSLICRYGLSAQLRNTFIDSIFQTIGLIESEGEVRQSICRICQDFQDSLNAVFTPIDSSTENSTEDVKSLCHFVFSASYPDAVYGAFAELALFGALTSFISFSYKLASSSKLKYEASPVSVQTACSPQTKKRVDCSAQISSSGSETGASRDPSSTTDLHLTKNKKRAFKLVSQYAANSNMQLKDYCVYCLKSNLTARGMSDHEAQEYADFTVASCSDIVELAYCAIEDTAERNNISIDGYLDYCERLNPQK